MSRTSSQVFRWSRLLPVGLGSLAIAGLLLLDGSPSVAQTKKDVKTPAKTKDAKAKDGEGEEKKTEVVYVQAIPSVTDRMVTTTGVAQVAKINELIKANWIANKVNPSDRCTDYEFIRRASLDIIGRIANENEIRDYMKQPDATRRSWLIEKLLANPEYSENLANIWTTLLLTRSGSKKMYQEQMREWLSEEYKKDDADWSKIATALLTAKGRTNENPEVNFIAHHIGEEIRLDEGKKGRPAGKDELRETGKYDMVPVTSRTTRLFLGVRTQCVQCHDHPFNDTLQQGQFWGINAFFRQTTVNTRPAMNMPQKKGKAMGNDPQIELHDEPEYNEKGVVSFETRGALLKYTSVKFLDGTRVKSIPAGSSRRAELAKLIVASPYFSKVYVNRTWAHFFGKSFTKDAADDFGDHNACSNPELLDYLAEQFKLYKHNPRDLIRWICNSQAYGLSSKANKYNDKPDDEVLFARMLLKTMTPEQLFESLMTATASGLNKEARHAARDRWLDQLVLNFGNDEGEEGTFSGTVVQALMLMNGDDINQAIMDQNVGTVASVIKEMKAKGGNPLLLPQPLVNKLYLTALNRPVTDAEMTRIKSPNMWMFHNPALKGRPNGNPEAFATGYYQDIFWALLNSNEFILNH